MSEQKRVRDLFLRFMSGVYTIAFASLYCQIRGLYGNDGILPASSMLNFKGSTNDMSAIMENFWNSPTLLWFMPTLGLNVSYGMELLCLVGILISFLQMLMRRLRTPVLYLLVWMCYFSCYLVGQTFLWFQWDILLLESGILAVVCAPFSGRHVFRRWPNTERIGMWLVKWLLFRLMFASGVVKLTSQCPTWWGLTALNWHYESQCLPTALAWWAHQLPDWVHRLSTVTTYFIEIAVPLLFFLPLAKLRWFAFYSLNFLMLLIMLTGNYNFFNILTCVLCISLLDDKMLSAKRKRAGNPWMFVTTPLSICVMGVLLFYTQKYFLLSFNASNWSISSKIAFTPEEFSSWLSSITLFTIAMAICSLTFEIVRCMYQSVAVSDGRGILSKLFSFLNTCLISSLAIAVFTATLVPHATVDQATLRSLPEAVRRWHSATSTFHLANSYGLFRRMTGVGGRPELIVSGSDDGKKFLEYELLYKPGNVSRMPPFNTPHQPRLDWQMWFAALGNYQHNPWLINFLHKLLNGDPSVEQFLSYNPFVARPPKFIKVTLYKYHYTKWKFSSSAKLPVNYWTRDSPSEYLPALSKDSKSMREFLKQNGLYPPKKRQSVRSAWLGRQLDTIHACTLLLPAPIFSLSFSTLACLLNSVF